MDTKLDHYADDRAKMSAIVSRESSKVGVQGLERFRSAFSLVDRAFYGCGPNSLVWELIPAPVHYFLPDLTRGDE